MEMLKKYSESHVAFKSVKNKLDHMLGKIQQDKVLGHKKQKQLDEQSCMQGSMQMR